MPGKIPGSYGRRSPRSSSTGSLFGAFPTAKRGVAFKPPVMSDKPKTGGGKKPAVARRRKSGPAAITNRKR